MRDNRETPEKDRESADDQRTVIILGSEHLTEDGGFTDEFLIKFDEPGCDEGPKEPVLYRRVDE
jgi:hypothetical protein